MTSSASRETEAVRGDSGITLIIEKCDVVVNAADMEMDGAAVARRRPSATMFRGDRAMVSNF